MPEAEPGWSLSLSSRPRVYSILVAAPRGEYVIVWQSEQLLTERGKALQMQDLDGDGQPEVLSVQAMGAAGQTMYVVAWRGQGCELLKPTGGDSTGRIRLAGTVCGCRTWMAMVS